MGPSVARAAFGATADFAVGLEDSHDSGEAESFN